MLVSGWQQALAVLLAVIPGFVYQGVRRRWRGPSPDDRDLSSRILRALAFSGASMLIYLAILGPWIVEVAKHPVDRFQGNARGLALAALVMLVVIPAAVGVLTHVIPTVKSSRRREVAAYLPQVDPTPSAWDFAANNLEPRFVRVLTKDGRWIGGYVGENSFVTGYPEPREIYAEEAYELDDDGGFGDRVNGTAGVWVNCADAQMVQFVYPRRPRE